jgi:hypothetical protein
MAETTLEQRVAALEETVRELQDAMNARKPAADQVNQVQATTLEEFDRILDELAAGPTAVRSLPADFSRADIYVDHN